MSISTTYKNIQDEFSPRYWSSIDEFEAHYLTELAEHGKYNYYTDRNGNTAAFPSINHFPELKEYEVWMEGYAATGESAGAHLVGKAEARNFAQACHIVMCEQYLKQAQTENSPEYTHYIDASRWDYDPRSLGYWGCRLFWSEELARKSFG